MVEDGVARFDERGARDVGEAAVVELVREHLAHHASPEDVRVDPHLAELPTQAAQVVQAERLLVELEARQGLLEGVAHEVVPPVP